MKELILLHSTLTTLKVELEYNATLVSIDIEGCFHKNGTLAAIDIMAVDIIVVDVTPPHHYNSTKLIFKISQTYSFHLKI